MQETLETHIAVLRGLFEQQLRIKGRDFAAQVRKAGRLLPRNVRRDALFLVQSLEVAQNPKLARMLDMAKVDKALANVTAFLQAQNPRAQMWDRILNVTASIALGFVVLFVVVIYVLVQKDLI